MSPGRIQPAFFSCVPSIIDSLEGRALYPRQVKIHLRMLPTFTLPS
jgi:hypothetical protein